jgi:hypothetical protein
MKKAELVNGTKIFVLKIEQFVTLSVFTQALGNQLYTDISPETEKIILKCDSFYFNHTKDMDTDTFEKMVDEFFNNLTFFKELTKKKAEEILRDNLKWHGRDGNMDSGMLEASYERGLIVNKCYDLTREWIIENYPHLRPTTEI